MYLRHSCSKYLLLQEDVKEKWKLQKQFKKATESLILQNHNLFRLNSLSTSLFLLRLAYTFLEEGVSFLINIAEFQIAKAQTYSFNSVLLLTQGWLRQFRSKVRLAQDPASKSSYKSESRDESMSKKIKHSIFPE